MPQQRIEFDAESVLRLLTHYSDGELPLDATLRSAGVSQYIQHWLGLNVESESWIETDVSTPLHIRYEGNKVLVWGDKHTPTTWTAEGAIEAPKQC